jgi:uncharacterized membrane protein YcfT
MTTPPSRPRLDWVDAGRGLAICLVANFHAANWLSVAGAHVSWWVDANLVVSSLRMPLFFTLSGLFAAKWIRGPLTDVLRVKVRLYAWVFLLWGLVGSAIFTAGVRMKGQGSLLGGTIVPFLISPVMPRLELWFIWALAIFFVVANLTAKVPAWLQLAVAGVGSAVALSGWETASPGWSGAVKYYAFFLAGLYLREHIIRFGAIGSRLRLGAVVSGWAVVAVGLWWLGWREVPGLYFLNCVLGVLAGIGVARAAARVRWLRAIGSRTLPIYLAHTPIIVLTSIALFLAHATGHRGLDLLVVPVVTAGAITLALRLNDLAVAHGAGWMYEPPAWFFGRESRPATPAAPAAGPATEPAGDSGEIGRPHS